MAVKISDLPIITTATDDDYLPMVDPSSGQTRRILKSDLLKELRLGTDLAAQAVKANKADFSVADQAARDAFTPYEGLQVFRRDTDAIEIYDGSAWIAYDTIWQTYTPVFYTNGTAYTIGNGTVVGRYFRTGKKVAVKIRLVMGSSTTWSGASGAHEVSIPFPSNYTANIDLNTPLGSWQAYNSAVASTNGNVELSATTSRVSLMYFKYGSTANDRASISNTAPFTSAVGDAQAGQFEYEMA